MLVTKSYTIGCGRRSASGQATMLILWRHTVIGMSSPTMAPTRAPQIPAALTTRGDWMSPWLVRTPVTRLPSVVIERTSVSSRTRTPRSRAARANPWAVSAGLQ